jgi:hypothetical protein
MGLGGERIPEEQHRIYATVHNSRADLLIATKGAGYEPMHRETGAFLEYFAGGAGGKQIMVRERPAVESGPFNKVWLAVIVGHEHQSLSRGHLK